MPVSALPSAYGIGSFGKEAYGFVDFLEQAGQSWWQVLPLGPTSYGDSPYQSFSTFAGNPYFVDPGLLIEDGLLTEEEADVCRGENCGRIDYGRIYSLRFDMLKKAADRGYPRDREKVERFLDENRGWLPDYALYMACKRHFGMRPWSEWDEDIRSRDPEAVKRYTEELAEDIRLFTYIQYLFFSQWRELREYAHSKGIMIIGDMPIYVAMDSADVWSETRFFALDEDNVPVAVAGVPPDAFSDDGQLWGNPLYDWDAMRKDGYGWWIRRVDGASRLFDVIRIDHFRGFESYWEVPYGEETAVNGSWRKGPGMALVGMLQNWFPHVRFIAEDLGIITDEVRQLLADSGLPGMRVLEFAFGSGSGSENLPHNYSPNCVCYAGTHDNQTVLQWMEEEAGEVTADAVRYFRLDEEEGYNWGMIRGGMASVADLFIAQMQDYLGLGAEGRMNEPSTSSGNWQWRMKEGQTDGELAARIAELTEYYGRAREDREEAED